MSTNQISLLTPELLHKIEIDLHTVSEANRREHWTTKSNRVRRQREVVTAALWLQIGRAECRDLIAKQGKLIVCIWRCASRLLDSDNLASSLKAVRDAVAEALCTNDGPKGPIQWSYEQESHRRYKIVQKVVVEIYSRGAK